MKRPTTELSSQLKKLAVQTGKSSAAQKKSKAPSILFEEKQAASLNLEKIYAIALEVCKNPANI